MKHLPNLICFAGLSAILYGLWTLYAPLMWVALGLVVCVAGIIRHRNK